MATDQELLAELLETAREQLRWYRAFSLPAVRETIERTLTTTQLRRAYEMSDGKATGTEIGVAVGASQPTMSNWARRWRDLGIAYEVEGRRTKHLISLSALGIPLEVDD